VSEGRSEPRPVQPPSHDLRSGFTQRHRAILRAIDTGRGEVLWGCVPTLLIDGLFCDQTAANDLFRAGLIRAESGPDGHRAVAKINDAGIELHRSGAQPVGEHPADQAPIARASQGEQR